MKKIIKKYTATSIIIASFSITVIMIFAKPSPKPVQNKFVPPVVETMDAIPQFYNVQINSQGTVVPRTEITLTSEIPGKIDFVSSKIQSGSSFGIGDTLLILDQRDFELALIAAQSSMYQAQVIYEREVAESEVAKKEWSNINGGKASNLALRKPQLDQAKAALAAAEANYQRALLNVERTYIRAPFKGRVRSEFVDIGMVVSPGIPLAQIYAIDKIEITLPIAESDIKFLSIPLDGRVVPFSNQPSMTLTSSFAGVSQKWNGKILRSAAEIDPRTRMLSVIESEVAKKEWSNINGGKASNLALRKPQLDQAKAALAAAEANYQRALLNVERTYIRAPFKGRVRSEFVDIGMVVSPGIPLAQIYAIDKIEITLPIAESDIKFLSIPLDGRVVPFSNQPSMTLTSSFAGVSQKWNGKILRSAAEIDPRTRMLSVIGQVSVKSSKNSTIPIKVGMFVNASIEGKSFNNIYVVPREKVRDGEVWVLNNEGILSKREVELLRYEKEKALISDGFEKGDKILLTRLDVLIEGMKLEKKDLTK